MSSTTGAHELRGSLLTVAEVAEALRVSSMTIYRLIKAGDLPALRVGKNYRIRLQDLEAYLASGTVHAGESNG
jgi:excisionase family DNA binding protein